MTRPKPPLEALDVECPYCLSMPKEWCGEYDNSANLVLWRPPKFHSARTRLFEKLAEAMR